MTIVENTLWNECWASVKGHESWRDQILKYHRRPKLFFVHSVHILRKVALSHFFLWKSKSICELENLNFVLTDVFGIFLKSHFLVNAAHIFFVIRGDVRKLYIHDLNIITMFIVYYLEEQKFNFLNMFITSIGCGLFARWMPLGRSWAYLWPEESQ